MLAGLVARDVAVVELRAVVVADEAGHLLKVLGLELNGRRRAEAVRLLAARDERLFEEASNRLAPVETQMARTRAQAEEFVGQGRSKPLKIDWQDLPVELLADGSRRRRLQGQTLRRRHLHRSECLRRLVVLSHPSAPHVIG